MSVRMLLILLVAFAPIPAAGDLAGRWVSLGPTHLYDVPQHIEVLDIAKDGKVHVEVWRPELLRDAQCANGDHPQCTNPIPVARGRVEGTQGGGVFSIRTEGPIAAAFPDPDDNELWVESSALSPEGWSHEQLGDRLSLTRPITLGRQDYALTRLFHRVEPGFDALFFRYYTTLFEYPIWGAICGLDLLLADPWLRAEFGQMLVATADVLRLLDLDRRTLDLDGIWLSPEDHERPFVLFLRQTDGLTEVVVPEGFDPDGWRQLLDVVGWIRRGVSFNDILFPAAEGLLPAVRDCHEAMHAPILPPAAELPPLPSPDPDALFAAGLIAGPPASGMNDLAGHWMHLGGVLDAADRIFDRGGSAADKVPWLSDHIEVLQIAPDGAVAVLVHRYDPGFNQICAADPALPECANPVEALRGMIVTDDMRLYVTGAEEVTPPFQSERNAAAWSALQIAAADWDFSHAGDLLVLSRKVSDETVTRRYLRVGPAFPATFYDFVMSFGFVLEVTMVEAGCALEAILAESDMTQAFAAHLERLLAGSNRFNELAASASASNDPALRDRYREIVNAMNDQIGIPGLAISAPEEFDPDAWVTWILTERWIHSERSADRGALFPAAAPLLPKIEACVSALR